jgi:hypothetical protein
MVCIPMGEDQGIAVERVLPQNRGIGDVDVTAQVFFLASVDEHNPTLGAFDNGSIALSHIEEADLEEREVSETGLRREGSRSLLPDVVPLFIVPHAPPEFDDGRAILLIDNVDGISPKKRSDQVLDTPIDPSRINTLKSSPTLTLQSLEW